MEENQIGMPTVQLEAEIRGIPGRVDEFGRIVIPSPLRDCYHLDGVVEIISTDKGILVRPSTLAKMPEKLSRRRK